MLLTSHWGAWPLGCIHLITLLSTDISVTDHNQPKATAVTPKHQHRPKLLYPLLRCEHGAGNYSSDCSTPQQCFPSQTTHSVSHHAADNKPHAQPGMQAGHIRQVLLKFMKAESGTLYLLQGWPSRYRVWKQWRPTCNAAEATKPWLMCHNR